MHTMNCPHCKTDKAVTRDIQLKMGRGVILECGHLITPDKLKAIEEANVTHIPIEKAHCPLCHELRDITEKYIENDITYRRLVCGHKTGEVLVQSSPEKTNSLTEVEPPIEIEEPELPEPQKERDERWNDLFPFQREGVEFYERAGFSLINGDDMGLGKTIQTIMALRYNREATLPALIVVPAQLTYQWQKAFKAWFNDKYTDVYDAPLIHFNSDGNLLRGFNIVIVSRSILGKEGLTNDILEYGFKTVIGDESQGFKNDKSSQTVAMKKICSKVPNRIMLSGTSVMNRIMEYFNPLQIVRPGEWPRPEYLSQYCVRDNKGRIVGISENRKHAFHNKTRDYVIRRRKVEVLKDLPPKRVRFNMYSLQNNKTFVSAYNAHLDNLENVISRTSDKASQANDILVLMTQMRHLVGLSKIKLVAERVQEHVMTDGDKITVGTHHTLVMETLKNLLQYKICPNCKNVTFDFKADDCEFCSTSISSGEVHSPICISDEPALVKDERCEQFRTDPNKRIMLASILGCGIGRNLQFCHNVIVAEREWNAAIEEQFEDRFYRIGTTDDVEIEYMLAAETIDEFFHEMVHLKGHVSGAALNEGFATSNKMLIDLANLVVAKRLKYVG